MTSHRFRCRTTAAGLLATAGLLSALPLAACSAPPPAMPAVVWKDGKAPSGPYENSTWVKAARTAETALNAAHNAGDYRMVELRKVSPALVDMSAQYARSDARRGEYFWYPGPTPAIVLSVSVSDDREHAKVIMCIAENWQIDKSRSVDRILKPSKYQYDMIDFGGGMRLSSYGPSLGTCTLTNPAIGYFKPAPDVTKTPKVSDIKRAPDQ